MTVDEQELSDGWRELLDTLADGPRLGLWVAEAACGGLGDAEVWTGPTDRRAVPDREEVALAARLCRRCPVRGECAAYADQARAWGLWGGRWWSGDGQSRPAEVGDGAAAA